MSQQVSELRDEVTKLKQRRATLETEREQTATKLDTARTAMLDKSGKSQLDAVTTLQASKSALDETIKVMSGFKYCGPT